MRIALLIGVIVPPAMAVLTALQVRRNLDRGRPGAFVDTADLGFGEVHLLTPCAIVFGVLAVAQEYTSGPGRRGGGRETTTVHLAIPRRRFHVLILGVLVMVGAAGAAGVSLLASHLVTRGIVGAPDWGPDVAIRIVGLLGTWAVLALLAAAFTWLTRSIVVPLVVLIVGSSLAPLSYLLSAVTPFARYLPDLAGTGMALRGADVEPLSSGIGMLTLAGWVVVALVVSAEVVARRDS